MNDLFSINGQDQGSNQVRWRFRYRAFTERWLTSLYPVLQFNLPGPDSPGCQMATKKHGAWFLVSKGPDGTNSPLPYAPSTYTDGAREYDYLWQLYDPTNGDVPRGDVIRGQAGVINEKGYGVNVPYE